MAYEYEQRMMKQRMEARRNKNRPVNQADYPVRELKQDAKAKREEQNVLALNYDLKEEFQVLPKNEQGTKTSYSYSPADVAFSESKKYRSLADRIQPVVTSQQKSTGENLYDIYNQLIALGESADWPVELPNPTSMYFDGFVDDYENLPDRMKSASAQKAVELYRQITPAKEAYDYASGLTGQVNNLYDQATMYEGLSEFYKLPDDLRDTFSRFTINTQEGRSKLTDRGTGRPAEYYGGEAGLEKIQKGLLISYYKESGLSEAAAEEKADFVYSAYKRAQNQVTMDESVASMSEYQKEHPVIANLSSLYLNQIGGFKQGQQAIYDLLSGISGSDSENQYYLNRDENLPGYQAGKMASVIRSETESDILGENPGFLNKAASTVYSGFMQALDNTARIYAFGDVGSLAMAGFSSFGESYQEAIERGASLSEASLYAGVLGSLEIITEKISLDRFLESPSKDSIKAIIKDAFMQGGIEITEEELSFLGGLLADALIMGGKSEYNSNVSSYMLEGKTEQEARKLASRQVAQDALKTALESFVSGGIMSGMAGTSQYLDYSAQGSKLSDTQRQALLTQANRLPGTESSQMYLRGGMDSRNAYFGALQGQVQQDISQRITGAETAEELFNLYREAIAETTPGVEAAADLAFMGRAQEMGQDVGDSAAAYATGAQIERQNRQSTGESWVDLILRRQYTADSAVERILNNESFRQEFAEKTGVEVPEVTLKGKNRSSQADINQAKRIVTNAIKNQEQRTQAYRDVYQKNEATAQEAAPEAQTGEAEERPLSAVSRENVTTPLPSPVSARVSGGEEAVEITGIKFRDGQMVAETSGGDFTLPELSISAGDKMGQVLNIAAGYGGNIARNFLSNYDGETYPKTYWDAYNAFLSAGKLAAGTEAMTFERAAAVNDAYARVLPQRAQMEAFSVGRESARAEEQAVKATVKKARKGHGTVEDKTTKKTPEQDSIVKLLGAYAKRTGIDVTILDSIRNGDAKANGSFVAATMSMYLSSEADNVLQTLGHESGEFISAFAPEEKAAIRDTVLKWWAYHENLNAVDQLIRKYQEQYKKAEGSKTYNQAADEAINDALGALLTTETGQKQFVDWISKDNTMDAGKKKSLVQSIKNAVRKILDGLNEYLKRKGVSEETRRFLKMEVSRQEKLMKQFFHALDVAVENARETGEYVEESAASYSVDVGSASYDYSKPFSEQLVDYLNGKIPEYDSLVVGPTPEVFKKIGLNSLQMTINQTHVDYALNGTKDADHQIGKAMLEQLPSIMEDPVAIIKSRTKSATSVVALVEFDHSGDTFFAPVVIDGYSRHNGLRFDSNSVTSLYKKRAAASMLQSAIQDEANGDISVYYVDTKRAAGLLQGAGVQFPGGLFPTNGYVHSIRDSGSPVNTRMENVTDSQQFKRWFGDWENNPARASKVVNEDGTPKVVYHGSPNAFTVFDYSKLGTTGTSQGKGFYFTDNRKMAENYQDGGSLYEVYLNIRKPLSEKSITITRAQVNKLLNAIPSEIRNDIISNWADAEYDGMARAMRETLNGIMDSSENDVDIIHEIINEAGYSNSQLADFYKILKNTLGYDGIISDAWGEDGMQYIPFLPTQVKLAYGNLGTFDEKNPDIRYSLSFEEESELLLSMGETAESREERWRSSFAEGAEVRTQYQMIEAESEAAMEELARTARGISTMEERLATQEALQRVSSATQDMVEYWRSQTKPHKGKTFQEASGKIARELKNSYQSQMNVNELSRGLQEIYNTLYSKGYEAAVEKAVELSKKLISKSIDTSGSLYEDYADARKYFRDKTVTISAEDAHDIPDFRDFQKRNFGRLKIGISYNRQQATIDGDFSEMAEMMPGFLDTTNTLAASDKLLAVAEALDAIYADRGVNPYEGSISETVNESALDMIQLVTGEFAEETFADKQAKALQDAVTEAKTEAQTEIQRLRDEAKRVSLEAENTIAQLRNSVRAERMGANTYLEQAKASKAGLEAAEQTVEQLRKQLKDTQERLQKAKGTPEERDAKRLADEMFYGRKAREGAVQEMERQKDRFAREQQRLQEAHRKAMDKELKRHETQLKNAEKRIQKAKDKLEKYRGDRDERDAKIRLRASVERRVKRLTDKIVKNDTKTYMPEVFKKDIGEFLMSLDFTSSSFNKKGELTERDRRYTNSLEKLNYTIMNLSREGADTDGILLHIPDEFTKEIEKHIEKVRESTQDIDLGTSQVYAMTSQQLKKLDEILATLENAVNRSNELIGNARFKRVNEIAGSDIRTMDRLGPDKVRGKTRGRTSSFLRWEMATPSTAFRRFGEGGSSIMDEYVDGQAKVAFMDKEVMDFSQKTFTDKEKDSWRKKTRTYTLESGKKVQLTDAMVMTLYESEKRVHAQGHLYGGGIVVAPDENIKVSQKRPFLLTEKDISKICKTVESDPRQKRVADAIQHFMASTGAKWGNEFTMQVYGKNSFTEEDYFPIESSGDYIKRSEDAALSKRSDFARILHISATKGLTEGANNPIMIRDIFTVFQDHISDMIAMNAFGVPVLDTIKWLNYQERVRLETGQVDMKSIRSSMESAYGEDAVKYVESFLKDVNGTEKAGRGEDFFSKWASRYKIASVGFNARVGLLQISAFPRAALEVEARYLRNGLKLLANFKDGKFYGIRGIAFRAAADEMLKYSGIALYKDLGFREINIGPNERKMLTDVDPTSRIDFYKKRFFTKEGISENSMWLAEKMDKFTWSAIWMACKAKTAAETNLRGEALLKETAKFFDRLCVKTQVFDSPIAKSQIMRSKSGLVKSVTSFMAEPITSYNAVLRSYDQISEAKRLGKKLPIKNFVSAVSVCSASMLFGAILESIMDVPRDDNDYKTKWEKFIQALVGDGSLEGFFLDSNLGNDMNPLNYIPYARDAVSALSGYENSDMTTAWMYESVKALKEIAEIWRVKHGFQEDYTKITYYGKKTEYGVIYDSLKALSHATGAPLSNLSRDLISMWNTTIGTAYPDLKVKTYEPSQETAIQEAFEAGYLTREEALEKLQEKVTDKDGNAISQDDAYWKLRSWETGSSSKLHTLTGALIAGEPEGIQEAKQELLAHGYETGDMDSVFTKAIGEAYKKDADGNYGNGRISRKQAEKYLLSYTGKNEKEVYKTLQEWDYAIENEGTDGFSVYNDLHSAIEAGGNLDKEKQALVSGGYSEKDINSEVKSYIGKLYKNGDFSKSDAQKLLGEYLGIDDEKELYDTFREWDYAAENGSGDGFSLYMDVDATVEAGKPIDSIIRELTAHGYKESDIRSEAVSYVGKLFLDGKISETKAGQLYVKYASLDEDGNKPDENDVYWKLKEWKYKKANPDAESYSRFDSLFIAIDNGANLSASIQEYLEHGYESKDLSSQITREYKKQFVKLWNSNRGQAEELMEKLLDAYEALGYSRSKKREDILDWLEES